MSYSYTFPLLIHTLPDELILPSHYYNMTHQDGEELSLTVIDWGLALGRLDPKN